MTDITTRFNQLFDSYAQAIFRYIYFRISDYESARDLASETFMKFWSKLQSGIEIKNERAFLYTIAHGLVVDEYRRRQSHPITHCQLDPQIFSTDDSLENTAIIREEAETVLTRLSFLKDEYQSVLRLHFIEGLKASEIGTILNKPPGTVRVLIHRALTAFKKLYD